MTAHRLALRDAPGRATVAGLPMVTLMVGYTVLSLWIIAAPIVVDPASSRGRPHPMTEVSIGLAFIAGLISFVSPCVLALLPVYLAFLGDASVADAEAGGTVASRTAIVPQALLFIGGFTAVFVVLGTSIGVVGAPLFRIPEIRQVAGIAVIALGVLTTGLFGPVLDRFRIGLDASSLPAARSARSLALGGWWVGWTPCIGPVLGAIFTMGVSSGSAPAVFVLLIAYSAGLAVPFLAAAIALPRLRPLLDWLRRHHRAVDRGRRVHRRHRRHDLPQHVRPAGNAVHLRALKALARALRRHPCHTRRNRCISMDSRSPSW